MRKEIPPRHPRPVARRLYRSRRLRLHPERKRRDEKLVSMKNLLSYVLEQYDRARALLGQAHEKEQKSEKEIQQLRQQQARARADLDNFRKRVAREKEDLKKHAARPAIEAFLPALDAFDHALAALDKGHDAEALAQGVEAIRQLFNKALEDQKVEKIDPLGETFDPELHEALGVEKTEDQPHNSIIDVLQAGYRLHEQLIRPARVRIAQKP